MSVAFCLIIGVFRDYLIGYPVIGRGTLYISEMACAELGVILTGECNCAADDAIAQPCYENQVCFKVGEEQPNYICAREYIDGWSQATVEDINKYCKSRSNYPEKVSLVTGSGRCDEQGIFYPSCTKFNAVLEQGEYCACDNMYPCDDTSMCYFDGNTYDCLSQNFGSISYGHQFALVGEDNVITIILYGQYYDPVNKVLIETCESQFTRTSQTCLCNPSNPSSDDYECKELQYCRYGGCRDIAEMYIPCKHQQRCGSYYCSTGQYCVNLDPNKSALDGGALYVDLITDGELVGKREYFYGFCTAKSVGQLCFGRDTLCTANHGCKCAVKGEGIESSGPCYGDETHYCSFGQEWSGLECLDPPAPGPDQLQCNYINEEGNFQCGDEPAFLLAYNMGCTNEQYLPVCQQDDLATEKCICYVGDSMGDGCSYTIISRGSICVHGKNVQCSPGYEYTDETHLDCKKIGSDGTEDAPIPCINDQENCPQVLPGVCKANSIGCVCNGEKITFKYCQMNGSAETVLQSCMVEGGLSDDFVVLRPCICGTLRPKLAAPGEICHWSELLKLCRQENGNMEADNKVTKRCYCGSYSAIADPDQYCIGGAVYDGCWKPQPDRAGQNEYYSSCACGLDIVEPQGYCYYDSQLMHTKQVYACTDSNIILDGNECVCTKWFGVATVGKYCFGTALQQGTKVVSSCELAAAGKATQYLFYSECYCGSDFVSRQGYCYSSNGLSNTKRVEPCDSSAVVTADGECVCMQSLDVAVPGKQCIGTALDASAEILDPCLVAAAGRATLNERTERCGCGSTAAPQGGFCYSSDGASNEKTVTICVDSAVVTAGNECVCTASLGVATAGKQCVGTALSDAEILDPCPRPPAGGAVRNTSAAACACGGDRVSQNEYCYLKSEDATAKRILLCAGGAGGTVLINHGGACVCVQGPPAEVAAPGDLCRIGAEVVAKCVPGATCDYFGITDCTPRHDGAGCACGAEALAYDPPFAVLCRIDGDSMELLANCAQSGATDASTGMVQKSCVCGSSASILARPGDKCDLGAGAVIAGCRNAPGVCDLSSGSICSVSNETVCVCRGLEISNQYCRVGEDGEMELRPCDAYGASGEAVGQECVCGTEAPYQTASPGQACVGQAVLEVCARDTPLGAQCACSGSACGSPEPGGGHACSSDRCLVSCASRAGTEECFCAMGQLCASGEKCMENACVPACVRGIQEKCHYGGDLMCDAGGNQYFTDTCLERCDARAGENCQYCAASPSLCSRCAEGFGCVVDGSFRAADCPKCKWRCGHHGCICEARGDCSEGLYCDQGASTCYRCQLHCAACASAVTCDECAPGFEPYATAGSGRCVPDCWIDAAGTCYTRDEQGGVAFCEAQTHQFVSGQCAPRCGLAGGAEACACGGALCGAGASCVGGQCLYVCARQKHCQYCDGAQVCRVCSAPYRLSKGSSCSSAAKNAGAIVGIAVGVIALLVAIVLTTLLLRRRKQGRRQAVQQQAAQHQLLLPVEPAVPIELSVTATAQPPQAKKAKTVAPTNKARKRATKLTPIANQGKSSRQVKYY